MRRWLIALTIFLVAGCGTDTSDRVDLRVGEHSISVAIPDGWEHLDYGEHHLLRKELAAIAIREIGGGPDSGPGRLGENEQRDVASRTEIQVGGRNAVVIDTWDRLSHQWRKRFCFFRAGEPLIAIFTMHGEFEAMEPAFEALLASVVIADSADVAIEAEPQ